MSYHVSPFLQLMGKQNQVVRMLASVPGVISKRVMPMMVSVWVCMSNECSVVLLELWI